MQCFQFPHEESEALREENSKHHQKPVVQITAEMIFFQPMFHIPQRKEDNGSYKEAFRKRVTLIIEKDNTIGNNVINFKT